MPRICFSLSFAASGFELISFAAASYSSFAASSSFWRTNAVSPFETPLPSARRTAWNAWTKSLRATSEIAAFGATCASLVRISIENAPPASKLSARVSSL
jgi:hypothetical protein